MVTVAVRFDLPGRYLYHCHIIEYEDTEVMRPFVVTVTDMAEGMGGRAPIRPRHAVRLRATRVARGRDTTGN